MTLGLCGSIAIVGSACWRSGGFSPTIGMFEVIGLVKGAATLMLRIAWCVVNGVLPIDSVRIVRAQMIWVMRLR